MTKSSKKISSIFLTIAVLIATTANSFAYGYFNFQKQNSIPLIETNYHELNINVTNACVPQFGSSGFQRFSNPNIEKNRKHVDNMERNHFSLPNGERTNNLEYIYRYIRSEYSNALINCQDAGVQLDQCVEIYEDDYKQQLNELLTEAVGSQCEVDSFEFGFSGTTHVLIPTTNDSDEDGIPDYFEIRKNLNPCSTQTFICGDQDGERDYINWNGTPDAEENWAEYIAEKLENEDIFMDNNFR